MPTLPTGERMPSGGVFPLISAVRARRAPCAVRRRQAPEHRLITPDTDELQLAVVQFHPEAFACSGDCLQELREMFGRHPQQHLSSAYAMSARSP